MIKYLDLLNCIRQPYDVHVNFVIHRHCIQFLDNFLSLDVESSVERVQPMKIVLGILQLESHKAVLPEAE